MKIKIDCTKEHLEAARFCDTSKIIMIDGKLFEVGLAQSCWIAVACQDIFPYCDVNILQDIPYISNDFRYSYRIYDDKYNWAIELPEFVTHLISIFDNSSFEGRKELNPFSFEIDIDNETLDKILDCNGFNLDNLLEVIKNTEHLSLVE